MISAANICEMRNNFQEMRMIEDILAQEQAEFQRNGVAETRNSMNYNWAKLLKVKYGKY